MKEQEIIELLKMESEEFKKLSEEHRLLDQQLLAIDSKTYLTLVQVLPGATNSCAPRAG